LLVDDDELVRETVAGILADRGYVVHTAAHGREALAVLGREEAIAAVILDIMMPEMEGIEALREIRKGWPGLPVIMISGGDRSGWTDALDMASKLGADRTLPKPFTPSQLIAEIDAALAAAKRR
jgi:two-component system phosphate regulon response regulator OmpR